MSFAKAEQLLTLAAMVAASHRGVTIADVVDRFLVSRRTAQRMLAAMLNRFPDAITTVDEAGHKRWMMPHGGTKTLVRMTSDELAAFDLAAELMKRSGAIDEFRQLRTLRDKMLGMVPKAVSVRLEADHEALLEARGFVARPGPKPRVNEEVAQAIAVAIKGSNALKVTYQLQSARPPFTRLVAPYGIITGLRRYLVGCALKDTKAAYPRLYVIDNIISAEVGDRQFERAATFDLQKFCERSFGVFQNDAEIVKIVLRFSPKAAGRAGTFIFHPTQVIQYEADGSLLVSFTASGLLEMAWHLYTWGLHVEVLEPLTLRDMVHPYRRSDFASLP